MQNTLGLAIQIIELPGLDGPQKRGEAQASEDQCGGNENKEIGHDKSDLANRSAFTVTSKDDVDMAMAATSGPANPSTATGIAIAL